MNKVVMYEYTKRHLALKIRYLQVSKYYAETNYPRGPWNKEAGDLIQQQIDDVKASLNRLDPDYNYIEEKFPLDALFQIHIEDYMCEDPKILSQLV
jgi:hypothetical protein